MADAIANTLKEGEVTRLEEILSNSRALVDKLTFKLAEEEPKTLVC